jgi:4-alpha-glucanotransferase
MGGIQPAYEDALGNRHAAPAETIQAIEAAIFGRRARDGAAETHTQHWDAPERRRRTIVTTERSALEVGPSEIRLEDGSTLTLDRVLPRQLPTGYHEIQQRGRPPASLIVAPPVCYLPQAFRAWGWAIQLYAARSRRSWGIGDLGDLRWLGRWAAKQEAGFALINPLAAATPTLPQQPSPYYPSSRRFRSLLYLRIEEVDGARSVQGLAALAAKGRALNSEREIDRDAIFRLKSAALERIWKQLRNRDDRQFERFRREQAGLQQFAAFCALAERFGPGWANWPQEFRHPDSGAIARTARESAMADRIRFHEWSQYQIDRQLARASAVMPVMQDLPIGFDAGGADGWAFQDVLAQGISVGAPPDEFNTKGQDWGLPPFVPDRLRDAGYAPFVQTIRACLRHAGGLRIDHAMGLFRLFWIPVGAEPSDGAYVRGHGSDLLSIVALESQRAKAVIVGEDLGTVEDEAREQLAARHILSYRLLWFEKTPPSRFPERALAAVTTHDLPTVAGLWSDTDVKAQKRLGLSPNEAGTAEIKARIRRLTRSGPDTPVIDVIARVHEALGRAPSRLVTATLDDAMAVEERPNMPATTDEWPNWRFALPRPIESLARSPLAQRIAKALRR